MPKPFDATLKDIVARHAADYAAELRVAGPEPVTVQNVDLATQTAASDVAPSHGDPLRSATDLNFQSGHDSWLAPRLLMYNSLLHHRLRVPVHSVAILLPPEADHPALTGRLTYTARPRRGRMTFAYEVVRLWRKPARHFLSPGLGVLPLAPLGRTPGDLPLEQALPTILAHMERRLRREATPEDAAQLLSATYILTGLRMPLEIAAPIFRRVNVMRESSTYLGILAEGEVAGLQKMLLRQGRIRFGPPDEATTTAIRGVTDPERLQRMGDRLLTAAGWADVLATP
jgi:hypothetical protein